jgi:hypothetical protein
MNMFCPNCGANNNRKQNYCRFCGLNLQDTAKSLTTQIVFGEDSNLLKTLSSVRRVSDFASTALVGVLIVCAIAFLFFEPNFSKDLMKISLGIFFLLKIIQDIIGYFQRKERSKTKTNKFEQNTVEQFESKETVRLLEEKAFEPVPSVIENSTELFPIENKTRKFE